MFTQNPLRFSDDLGGPEHRGHLHWPGTAYGNFPFRGDEAPNLRGREADDVQLVFDYHSKMFRLWDEAEHTAFNQVMERIANGWYMQNRRYDNWITEQQHYIVWLEWVQIYGETVTAKTPGGKRDGTQPYVVGSANRGRTSFMQQPGVRRTNEQRPGVPLDRRHPLQTSSGESLL